MGWSVLAGLPGLPQCDLLRGPPCKPIQPSARCVTSSDICACTMPGHKGIHPHHAARDPGAAAPADRRDDLPEAPLLDCVNGALAVLRQELGARMVSCC